MNQYIKKVENVVLDSTDKTGFEPAHLNEIQVCFVEPPQEGKYNLCVEHVRLWNEHGVELPCTKDYTTIPVVLYPSNARFFFAFDEEFVELLDGAVFEISLKKMGHNPIETIKYILKGNKWEEMVEGNE